MLDDENTRSQACDSSKNPQSTVTIPAKDSRTRKTVQQRPLSRLPESRGQVERAPKVQSPASTIRNTRRLSSVPKREAPPSAQRLSRLLVEQSSGPLDAFSKLASVRPGRRPAAHRRAQGGSFRSEAFLFARGLGEGKPPSGRGRRRKGVGFQRAGATGEDEPASGGARQRKRARFPAFRASLQASGLGKPGFAPEPPARGRNALSRDPESPESCRNDD